MGELVEPSHRNRDGFCLRYAQAAEGLWQLDNPMGELVEPSHRNRDGFCLRHAQAAEGLGQLISLHILTASECPQQRGLVRVLQIAAGWQSTRQAGDTNAQRCQLLFQEQGCGVTFHTGVGGQNDL